MKSPEEIQRIAEERYPFLSEYEGDGIGSFCSDLITAAKQSEFIKIYTLCQEEMKKEIETYAQEKVEEYKRELAKKIDSKANAKRTVGDYNVGKLDAYKEIIDLINSKEVDKQF